MRNPKSPDVALSIRIVRLPTSPSPCWCGTMGDTHLRLMLEKPVCSEGQGLGSIVYVEGNDIGEVDYIREASQRVA